MVNLGKLVEITDLRSVWPHEALDFTPWLAQEDNLAILADTLDIDISLEETESAVGDFSVDILAKEVGTDKKIIIENQLEDTNHDHLGKLITYASGKGANYIIWVVKRAREEHKSAIEWLNNHTDDSVAFFLVEVKVFRIGNSEPAPKFEIIEQPNNWAKEIKKASTVSGKYGETLNERLDFWTQFSDYAFKKESFSKEFRRRTPSTDHWLNFFIGNSDCHIAMLKLKDKNGIGVELYIENNKELFHSLYSNKDKIESEIGFTLDWRELPERKASRIVVLHDCNSSDRNDWNNQFEWLTDTAVKLKKAFKKYL